MKLKGMKITLAAALIMSAAAVSVSAEKITYPQDESNETAITGASVTYYDVANSGGVTVDNNAKIGYLTDGVRYTSSGDTGHVWFETGWTISGTETGHDTDTYKTGNKAQVVIDLKEKKTFSAVRVYARKDWKREAITKATLYVSDDGLVWAKSKKQSTATASDDYFDAKMWVGSSETNCIQYNVSARYIKLEIEETPMGVWAAQEIVLVDQDETLENRENRVALSNELAAPYKTDEVQNATVSSVSGSYAGSLTPDNMFDGVTEGIADGRAHWESPYVDDGSSDEQRTVTVTFENAIDLGGVRIYPRLDNKEGMVKHLTVYGSYDGTTYSLLANNVLTTVESDSGHGYRDAVQGDTLRVDFPVSAKGIKSIKLLFDDNINDNKKFVTVAEARFLKATDAPVEISLSSDSGVYENETAAARFITKFDKADNADAIEYYGTYVLPTSGFNKTEYQDKFAGKFIKEDGAAVPSSGKTYAVDLKNIPKEQFTDSFTAISFVKFTGSDVIIWSDPYVLNGINQNKKLASEGEK